MPDLKQRLDAIDLLPVDDVWSEVRDRLETETTSVVRPNRAGGPRRSRRDAWRKALTIAAAFALAIGSVALAIRAFGGRDDRTVPTNDGIVEIPIDGDALDVVGADGAVWVLGTTGVTKIDPASNAVIARFPMSFPDGGRIAA